MAKNTPRRQRVRRQRWVRSDRRRRLDQTIRAIASNHHAFKLTTFYVDRLIAPQPFNPAVAYANLYQINAASLAPICQELQPHFLDLRLQLEYAYIDLSLDPDWELYGDRSVELIQQQIAQLQQLGLNWDSQNTLLPSLTSNRLPSLLQSDRFVAALYKLNKIAAILQQQNHSSLSSISIVATTVSIDGSITNRCEMSNCVNAKTVLDLHQKSIVLGQIEWQKWLNFLISLCRII